MQQGRDLFVNLELCFPPVPTFDKCCLVPNSTEHLMNKELNPVPLGLFVPCSTGGGLLDPPSIC